METGPIGRTPTGAGDERPPRQGRFPFIDALRGLAVLFMIETHTVNALLDPALRAGAFYHALTYVNGLVAPAFLFCAGLGFAIFLTRKNDEIVALGRGFRSYAVKCLFIILLGYSLHVPRFSLKGMIAAGPGAWVALLQVDILQVIGVTLLLLLLGVAVAVRSSRGRTLAVSALTAAALLWWYVAPAGGAAPAGEPANPAEWIATGLLAYLSRALSPLFTIVPWGAFLTAGFLAGTSFARSAAAGREKEAVIRLAAVSALLAILAPLVTSFTGGFYGPGEYWYWSLEYFAARLGSVGLVMCALWALLRKGGGPASGALELLGRESLPVYYVHLIIVYGKDFGWSFVRLFPAGGTYLLCGALFIPLAAAMVLYGRAWSACRRRWPRASSLAVRALVAGSALTFLFA